MAAAEAPRLELDVQVAEDTPPLPAGADFPRWARAALAAAGERGATARRPGSLSVRVVGLAEGARLNGEWRHKSGPTNVLAFPVPPAGPGLPPGLPVEYGDLVICLPVVLREAAEQGKAPVAHLAHLTVHGMLHLLGHNHEVARDAKRMEALETRILAGLGLPDPYVTG